MNPNPMNPQQPASQAKKMSTAVIVLIVMGVLFIPCVGCLAAIAIPNFIRFQARSKQSEAKSNLKAAYIGQKSLLGEKDVLGTRANDIGFSPDRSRYLYLIGEDELAPTFPGATTTGLRDGVPADLLAELDPEGQCPDDCTITMIAAGNIDNDATVDVWSVSMKARTIGGVPVPAGQPYNHINDVSE